MQYVSYVPPPGEVGECTSVGGQNLLTTLFIWSSTLFHIFLHNFGRQFLFFEDQFALGRHLFCGKMVVIFSPSKIDLVLLLKQIGSKIRIGNS